jgi:acetyl-CoA synthetase
VSELPPADLPASEPFVPVPADAAANTHCSAADYERLYTHSIDDPDAFWAEQAKRLDWITPPTTIANWSYDPVEIKWYEDGVLNLCHNAVDRHVAAGHGERTAIIFEPDSPDGETRTISYKALLADVIRFANTLKKMGVQKGDRVTIYMPMIPEAPSRCWPARASARSIQCRLRRLLAGGAGAAASRIAESTG